MIEEFLENLAKLQADFYISMAVSVIVVLLCSIDNPILTWLRGRLKVVRCHFCSAIWVSFGACLLTEPESWNYPTDFIVRALAVSAVAMLGVFGIHLMLGTLQHDSTDQTEKPE